MRNPIDLIHHGGPSVQRKAGKLIVALSVGLVLVLLLVGCSTFRVQTSSSNGTGSSATAATSTSAGSGTSTPATTTSTPSTISASGTPSATPSTVTTSVTPSSTPATSATPTSSVEAAIKDVIQRGNQEQQQAYASQNPSVMQDTATASYYNQLVQGLQDLSNAGVTAIKLDHLSWGAITLQGTTTAQATTSETWSTTYQDGSSDQQTNINVYSLVLQNGHWKIQDDQQPNAEVQPSTGQNPSGNNGSGSTSPVTTVDPVSAGQSSNWSGYYATGGTFTSVSGAWTVPTVSSASSAAADATWVGIGGVRSTDLIQAGTDATVQSGQVTYEAWIETLPQASQTVPLTVHAGDKVSATIKQQADGTWQIVIKDLTTTQTYQTTVAYSSSLSSAEWIEETPSIGRGLLPLDNFGSISFKSATAVVNGRQETVKQAGGQPITMDNNSGQVLVQPSALGSDGASFTLTRTSAPSNQFGRGFRRNYP